MIASGASGGRSACVLRRHSALAGSIRYDFFPQFGARYVFELKDAIDNCPEYLVHIGTLCK